MTDTAYIYANYDVVAYVCALLCPILDVLLGRLTTGPFVSFHSRGMSVPYPPSRAPVRLH